MEGVGASGIDIEIISFQLSLGYESPFARGGKLNSEERERKGREREKTRPPDYPTASILLFSASRAANQGKKESLPGRGGEKRKRMVLAGGFRNQIARLHYPRTPKKRAKRREKSNPAGKKGGETSSEA